MHEPERRVPRPEFLHALEEADDPAVPGIGGHPVPESRREDRRTGFDDLMEPPGYDAIRLRHRRYIREHGGFPVRRVRVRAGLLLTGSCWLCCFFHTFPLLVFFIECTMREYSDDSSKR